MTSPLPGHLQSAHSSPSRARGVASLPPSPGLSRHHPYLPSPNSPRSPSFDFFSSLPSPRRSRATTTCSTPSTADSPSVAGSPFIAPSDSPTAIDPHPLSYTHSPSDEIDANLALLDIEPSPVPIVAPTSLLPKRPAKGPDYVTRPRTAFQIFNMYCCATHPPTLDQPVPAETPTVARLMALGIKDGRLIASTVTKIWKNMTETEKEFWEDRAEEMMQQHVRDHPEYHAVERRFGPRKRKQKGGKVKRERQLRENISRGAAEAFGEWGSTHSPDSEEQFASFAPSSSSPSQHSPWYSPQPSPSSPSIFSPPFYNFSAPPTPSTAGTSAFTLDTPIALHSPPSAIASALPPTHVTAEPQFDYMAQFDFIIAQQELQECLTTGPVL